VSWRDTFNGGKGKFRTAEFYLESDAVVFGRRKERHEFPLRDEPFIEDTGGSQREFSIEAYVIGNDYFAARDRLIAALEEKGAGTLVHPYFGSINVEVLGKPRVRQTTREGGKASFSITFIRVQAEKTNLIQTDTGENLKKAINDTQQNAQNDFMSIYSTLDLAQDYVDETQAELDDALRSIEQAVAGITEPITALIRAPFNLASAIMGTFNNIQNSIKDPFRAMSLYRGLFDSGRHSLPIPSTTSNRKIQIDNTAALHRLIQQAAITEASRLVTQINFASSDDALAMRDTLLNAIDAQVEEPAVQSSSIVVSDAVYDSLQQLRATLTNYIYTEAAKLPRVSYFNTLETLPALVLAQRIYGDVDKADEIVSRNNIRHPGFVLGGQSLEVLSRG